MKTKMLGSPMRRTVGAAPAHTKPCADTQGPTQNDLLAGYWLERGSLSTIGKVKREREKKTEAASSSGDPLNQALAYRLRSG